MPKNDGYSRLEEQSERIPLELEFELVDFDAKPGASDETEENDSNEAKASSSNSAIDESMVINLLRDNDKKSTMRWAFMNMANSILGAGVVGQPFAIRNCGIIGGILAYIILVLLVDWTLRLIVINLTLAGKKTYQDTVEFALGRKGRILVLLSNGLFAFGGCIGFCIIIGDTIPHFLQSIFHSSNFFFRRNVVITIVTLFISYPLSLQRNIAALSKASFLALISMVVIVFSVVVQGPRVDMSLKGGKWSLTDIFISSAIFRGISVISFALVCHHNTSFIFFSIKNRSLQKFARLTHISTFISMIFCMLMGYSGYSVFRDKTKGNILNNFPQDDLVINIARLCFGFNMLTTFPLEIFVLRDVIAAFLYGKKEEDETEAPPLSTRKLFIITTVCVVSTMSISLTTCNLGALFELIGATTASTMAYILPPYTNLVLSKEANTFRQRVPHYLCIFFGFMVMIVSSTQTIIEVVKGSDQRHCEL